WARKIGLIQLARQGLDCLRRHRLSLVLIANQNFERLVMQSAEMWLCRNPSGPWTVRGIGESLFNDRYLRASLELFANDSTRGRWRSPSTMIRSSTSPLIEPMSRSVHA